MADSSPVVLIASVSPHERQQLEPALLRKGWSFRHVADASEAARQLDGGARRAVLVIDAGLLDMPHDAQWRVLRSRYPELGVVVRCLGSRTGPPRRRNATTLEVHPDDLEAMSEAVRRLSGPSL